VVLPAHTPSQFSPANWPQAMTTSKYAALTEKIFEFSGLQNALGASCRRDSLSASKLSNQYK
jgi:hypothetical protein